MRRIRMVLMATVAVMAIGVVGTSVASADPSNHGFIQMERPALLGGGTADCDFTFDKTTWSGGDPYSTVLDNFQAVSPCDVDSLSGGVELWKDTEGNWWMDEDESEIQFTVDTGIPLINVITCTYSMDSVFGTWVHHPADSGPPPVDAWKEFTIDSSSTATRISPSSGFCPNPGKIVGGYIHTDTN